MQAEKPSLYPKPSPTESTPAPTLSETPAPPRSETLPPDYELLLEINARVVDLTSATTTSLQHASSSIPYFSAASSLPPQPTLSAPVSGTLRVIQGPLPPSSPDLNDASPFYHAFLSVGDVSIPLLPKCVASRGGLLHFQVTVPSGQTLSIEPNNSTQPELVDALERLLRWFCQWSEPTASGVAAPVGFSEATPLKSHTAYPQAYSPAADAASISMQDVESVDVPPPQSKADRFAAAGDKGVEIVERVGSALHRRITSALEAKRDAVEPDGQRSVKLGGKATSSLLSVTRKVVGAGATVASKLTDRISSSVGSAMSNSKVSRSMSQAPEGSLKRSFYDNLMAGGVVVGRVYVAADKMGKMIIEDAGDRAAQIAGKKYGGEAESATRNLSHIAVDGYRIARFPQKLGAVSILRGAVTSNVTSKANGAAGGEQARGAATANPEWRDVSGDDIDRMPADKLDKF